MEVHQQPKSRQTRHTTTSKERQDNGRTDQDKVDILNEQLSSYFKSKQYEPVPSVKQSKGNASFYHHS